LQDVIIIGGGVAGLISANCLASVGLNVRLFERKEYPFHRVCGEYISNEVAPFLRSINCYPEELGPTQIQKFQLTSVLGRSSLNPMDIGGFGISRYSFDSWLSDKAKKQGADIQERKNVSEVRFVDDFFEVKELTGEMHRAKIVIGAFGKRSTLDKGLQRRFIQRRSPFMGVKYHARLDLPPDKISLHNFRSGYCGIAKVDNNAFNICYLVSRAQLKRYKTIDSLESNVLRENPYLDRVFSGADFLFDRPVVINEVSFSKKEPIWNHMIMIGDSAGMIAPLCGNGMAMAIQSAQISIQNCSEFIGGKVSRQQMESEYYTKWNQLFSKRLWIGRVFQKTFFGSPFVSTVGVSLLRNRAVARKLVALTHGRPIK